MAKFCTFRLKTKDIGRKQLHYHIEAVEFQLSYMVFNLHDDYLAFFNQFINNSLKIIDKQYTNMHYSFIPEYLESNQRRLDDRVYLYDQIPEASNQFIIAKYFSSKSNWQQPLFLSNRQTRHKIYIKAFRARKINLILSLQFSPQNAQTNDKIFSYMKSIGMILGTINEAQIELNEFYSEEIYGTREDVVAVIKAEYLTRFKQNLMSILGSSGIIGNPIKFASCVKKGFVDLYRKPKVKLDNGEGG